MKKAILLCLIAILAARIDTKAQVYTIELKPGTTWISYPMTDTLDFSTALGSFSPVVGDKIKSKTGTAAYRGNGQWRGTISQFYPGYGYMYWSSRTEPVTLTWGVLHP